MKNTEKLLDVLGVILSPALAKFRMTQFGEVPARGELNAVRCGTKSSKGQAAQMNAVGRAGSDGDGVSR